MADEQNSIPAAGPVAPPQPEISPASPLPASESPAIVSPPPTPPTPAIGGAPLKTVAGEPEDNILSKKPTHKEIIFGILVILAVIGGIYAFAKFAAPTFLEKLTFGYKYTPTPEATATPTPDPLAGWQTYSSKHGFSLKYPENWRLEAFVEQQDNIKNSQTSGANYFQIYSYPSENSYNPSEPVPTNELKIEAWIKEENYQTIEEFISSAQGYGIMGTNELIINGERAVKILSNSDMGPILSAYYVSGGKSVEFVSYPYDSAYSAEFDSIVQTFKFTNQSALRYELRRLGEGFTTDAYYDAMLVRIDTKTNEETVLVQSTKNAIPELKEQFNRTIQILSTPNNSRYLYFLEILSETDAPPFAIFSFNLETNSFKKLEVSDYYAGFGAKALSPDGKNIVTTLDPNDDGTTRKLFLLNLELDKVTMLVQLPSNETLNFCISDCFGGNQGNVEWKDNNTIKYSVYDYEKSAPDQYGNIFHPLIEIRQISID